MSRILKSPDALGSLLPAVFRGQLLAGKNSTSELPRRADCLDRPALDVGEKFGYDRCTQFQ